MHCIPQMPVRRFMLTLLLLALGLTAAGQEKKGLTFDQIFKGAGPRVTTSLPSVTGWADDDHYLEVRRAEAGHKGGAYAIEAASGAATLYRDMEQYRAIIGVGIEPSAPASATEKYDKLIYVKENDLFFLNAATREFRRLTQTPGVEKNPTISPDGAYVAFTRDNNLFAIELASGKEKQYTADGSDVVYNGWASWVYYEEIFGRPSRYRAFWWSPDSRHLAFFRFDDSRVPFFPLFSDEGVNGSVEQTRYPKPGDPNPAVRCGIVPVVGGRVTWARFDEGNDQYFGTPFWAPGGASLWVQWMNRGQDTLKLVAVDPSTGATSQIAEEHQSSWVEWYPSITFLSDGSGFIVKSDRDGWKHLYLVGMDGKVKQQLTRGTWEVVDLLCVNLARRRTYFTARKEATTRTDLYSVSLDGTGLKRLTTGLFTHSVQVSPSGKYFITSYGNVATPTRMALHTEEGTLVRELADSKTNEFDRYELARTELFTIPTFDGYALPAIWTLPAGFDPAKRYPVLISVYGGPLSPTVSDGWKGIGEQWLAQEGVIQMSVDHRGSGHFGKEGAAQMYRCLGKWEMHDYGEAARWLRSRPFVDTTKICITGASYGGYVACMALTAGAGLFTHGLAGSSVTDWRLYDSHYTERYMDTPAENPEGYKEGSVMTHADRYRGLLRIVHGTMDDNVHMQNALRLVDTLEDLNKHFELLIYPGGRHGWGGPKAIHSRNENYRFYYRYLIGKEFPDKLFQGAGLMGRRRR
ncbi:MAG: S9 family peptidase [Bacteroidota bacterium]